MAGLEGNQTIASNIATLKPKTMDAVEPLADAFALSFLECFSLVIELLVLLSLFILRPKCVVAFLL